MLGVFRRCLRSKVAGSLAPAFLLLLIHPGIVRSNDCSHKKMSHAKRWRLLNSSVVNTATEASDVFIHGTQQLTRTLHVFGVNRHRRRRHSDRRTLKVNTLKVLLSKAMAGRVRLLQVRECHQAPLLLLRPSFLLGNLTQERFLLLCEQRIYCHQRQI